MNSNNFIQIWGIETALGSVVPGLEIRVYSGLECESPMKEVIGVWT